MPQDFVCLGTITSKTTSVRGRYRLDSYVLTRSYPTSERPHTLTISRLIAADSIALGPGVLERDPLDLH